MQNRFRTAAYGLAVLLLPRLASADEPVAPVPLGNCSGGVTRRTLAACALAKSPALREELASHRVGEGRRQAARPFLPSNPVLSGALASRASPTGQALNWNVGLSQEFEIAGQSWLRTDVAEHELRAQAQRLAARRADIAADAWLGYFRSIGAQERLKLALKLETATEVVSSTVRAMTSGGLASEVDADVAEAAAIRAAQERLKAEQQVGVADAQLRLIMGGDVVTPVTGVLEPLKSVEGGTSRPLTRPELLAVREGQTALGGRVDLLRRTRIPNPSLSLFAQSDGFNEQVLGVGLSFPIPLPQPVGRTLSGEIAEGAALVDRAEAEAERVQRELEAELAVAAAEYDANLRMRALFTPERVQRATARLEAITQQIRAARLPVRDALVAQQALVEQLKADIDTREALCVASVRLTRAAGLSLEGDSL